MQYFINKSHRPSFSMLIDWGLKLALLLIIIPVIVPFAPKMPAPGLDASWALGLNQAVAQGLAFGKEIIFTLGPYSSVYTKSYHPYTDLMMMGGSAYLALSYWMALILLTAGTQWRWIIAFGILLLGMIYARDSLFFSYPLIVGLISLKRAQEEDHPRDTVQFILLFAPFGLLALIKGSLLILILVMSALCSAFFSYSKKHKLAIIGLIIPICSMLSFWLLAGQALFNLPYFITSSISLASGFTEAMAVDGDSKELILYLIASGMVLFGV